METVRQVRSGQAIAVVAQVLGIPSASLGNWVRLSAQGQLSGVQAVGCAAKVSPEPMELARLRAENARLRMECNIAKKSGGVLCAGPAARCAWIYQIRKLCPVILSCEVLQVSASGYFSGLKRHGTAPGRSPRRHSDEDLLAHIRDIHAEVTSEYGWPRMHQDLLAKNHNKVCTRVRLLTSSNPVATRLIFIIYTLCTHIFVV